MDQYLGYAGYGMEYLRDTGYSIDQYLRDTRYNVDQYLRDTRYNVDQYLRYTRDNVKVDQYLVSPLVVWVICVLCVSGLLGFDAYILRRKYRSKVKRFIQQTRAVINDFRSARYYKPWNSAKPIIVTTKKQIQELSEASQVLSQRAVYADMFGFKHTLNGYDHHEVNTAKSRLFGRLLQVQGTANLPKVFPFLTKRLNESLGVQLRQGKLTPNGISLPVANTVRVLASRLMGVTFFGENLSADPKFADALLRHPKDMVSCLAAFQVTPGFLSSAVHSLITRGGQSQKLILSKLAYILGPGYESWDEPLPLKELTFAWNMVQLTRDNPYWTSSEQLAQNLLGAWFAAAHQPWMNLDFITLSLCVHPEIQDALREEIGDLEGLDYERLQNMPLLDSFIKETVRLHPLDTMAVRRKALKDYTFVGGAPFVKAGSTVCVSSYDKMHDDIDYPNPNSYQPRRFLDTRSPVRGTKFTDVSEKFPVWGFGSLACPGRFHASIVIKLILVHLIMKFDLRLEDEKARRLWSWETFTMPYESTRFVLKART
ncbi:cytochrome P450 [Lojkania enalia]|uniref:Cytochrome P450 n=1 Tax=Lojkania enalia TaxID=147567 RepID=A0A9P4KGX7_9PLEO|nr:cytochrome P450 [Didymosphaeria enalia]